jgi:thymidylate kinase
MTKKLIIFVGPDMCGKTEIGKALAKRMKFQYFKNHSEHKRFKNEDFVNELKHCGPLTIQMYEQIEFEGNGLILDRFTPCEWVYSRVYGRATDEELIWELDNKLAKLEAVIVYCYKDSYKNFEDEVVKEKDIQKIKDEYEKYFKKSKLKVIRLNTTSEDLSEQLRELSLKLYY